LFDFSAEIFYFLLVYIVNMSLSSIKQKEAKGKKKLLPKLRNILANPYKQHR